MKYKYKKWQIFSKNLEVPIEIRNKVYSENISLQEFVEYDLFNKVPFSCIKRNERKIIEKFGYEKIKDLDWELLYSPMYSYKVSFILLEEISKDVVDINKALYEILEEEMEPTYYSKRMKEYYPDRAFTIEESDSDEIKLIKREFNQGNMRLITIIDCWDILKDKDLSYCLSKDYKNDVKVTDEELKKVISKYEAVIKIIASQFNEYELIKDLANLNDEEKEKEYIKTKVDLVINNYIENEKNHYYYKDLTNEELKELFKYTSFEERLLKLENYSAKNLIKELKTLPEDYIYESPIPISLYFNYDVVSFIGEFGLKNVVDFDNECGQFFTKNNCEMLKLMEAMYMHYGGRDRKTTIYTKNYDENGNFREKETYTKDEFYEAMRRMIIYGPSNWDYQKKAPDYRTMTGEFRRRNQELFIDENAPEELKKLFYTKKITPTFLYQHKEYIKYLKNKDVESYMEYQGIHLEDKMTYENFYKFLLEKESFENVMNYLVEYSYLLKEFFSDRSSSVFEYNFLESDDLNEIKNKINALSIKKIIEGKIKYPEHIPQELKNNYPTKFISEEAPEELKNHFYNRTLTIEMIKNNPSYHKYLKEVDLDVVFPYMYYKNNNRDSNHINFVDFAKLFFHEETFDFMLEYGKFIEIIYSHNLLSKIKYNKETSQESIKSEIDELMYNLINEGKVNVYKNAPEHFRQKYPRLFINTNMSKEITDKFNDRLLKIEDFQNNPDLIEQFGNTNIAYGFDSSYYWIIPLFKDLDNQTKANYNRLKILSEYSKITDYGLKEIFKQYVIDTKDTINMKNIDVATEVLQNLLYSNAIELYSFRTQIAKQVLNTQNPIETLEKIERIFLQNNLPLFGKMYLCFNTLYPNLSDVKKFSFDENSRFAPELKTDSLPNVGFHSSDDEKRRIIIFNDLLRIAYRSNERSFVEYLDNIEKGNNIYLDLQNNKYSINDLTNEQKAILNTFVEHLEVLYQNTQAGKETKLDIENLSIEEKIEFFKKAFKENERYDLKDRIIRSFCFNAGVESFEQLKQLCDDSVKEQEKRIDKVLKEIENNRGRFKFQLGDYVRCTGKCDSLGSSLETGNFCKEHLGVFTGTSESDTTPLDVDLSLIDKDDNIFNCIKDGPTGFGFGNIYVIIKKDNPNIYITRDKDGNLTDEKYNPRNIEVFGTRVKDRGYETHWGARTGISFRDVDCILYKKRRVIDEKNPYDEKGNVNYIEFGDDEDFFEDLPIVKFEVVKNGFYIPIIDFTGKVIFTKKEYEQMRNKMMQGLAHFKQENYTISPNIINTDTKNIANELSQDSVNETIEKRKKINAIIKTVLDKYNLKLKDTIDGDLSPDSVEFIDTGSTGRNTNVPHDGDFDFFMRLDAKIMRNDKLLNQFKNDIMETLKQFPMAKEPAITDMGDYRFKGVKIDNDTTVDIDISFGVKTNKVSYSSDECLRDRLTSIYKQYPDKYKYVVANIILAKKVLKEADVYKNRRTDSNQGGLGGIGVENWILQNGGSFIDAASDFLKAAIDENGEIIPFEEFRQKYELWDCGENHFAARKGNYLHDNFITNNMNETGYKKMIVALKNYLEKIKREQTEEEGFSR